MVRYCINNHMIVYLCFPMVSVIQKNIKLQGGIVYIFFCEDYNIFLTSLFVAMIYSAV
jgi:hypothetical protein